MTAEIPKPAEIRKTKGYLWRRIASKWPFLVWLGMALLTFKLYQSGVKFDRMNGVIVADIETITALEDGLVKEMTVAEKGDSVDPEQAVVTMDDVPALAEREEIIQEVKLARIKRKLDASTLKTGLDSQISELEIDQETEAEELRLLKEELPKLEAQLEKRAIENSVYQAAVQAAALLEIKVAAYPDRIASLKSNRDIIEEDIRVLNAFDNGNPEDHVLVKSIDARIKRLVRKSSKGGEVSQVYAQPNSFVSQGDPIVDIVNSDIRRAKGFILEKDANQVAVGTKVYISVLGSDDQSYFEGEISFVSPEITSVSEVGGAVSGRMIKGREITCTFNQSEVDLIPGTSITIALKKPGKFSLFSKD